MESNGEQQPPWNPDLGYRDWIVEVRDALGLTQGEFAALIGTVRDTESKWEGKNSKDGPTFDFTRRIATVSPAKQLAKFIGARALADLCLALRENPTGIPVGEIPEWRERAATLVVRLGLLSESARWAALTRFEDAIEKEAGRPGRDLRLVGKQRHGTEPFGPAFAESQRRADKSINSIRNSRAATPPTPKRPPRKRQRKT